MNWRRLKEAFRPAGRLNLGLNRNMRYVCGLLLLLQVIPVNAQFSGRVTGSVADASGAVVPNADVELFLAGGKKPLLTTQTSGEGLFNFTGMRPPYYDSTVQPKSF